MSDDRGIVVLGAGLAGLTVARATGAPLYEAEAQIGGVAASDRVDGFIFDRGIHILQTRNVQVLDLLRDAGVVFTARSRNAYIYSHGKYTAYPFQVNTAGLPLGLRWRCVAGFLRRQYQPEPTNYEEWIYRSVGKGFAETFLIPYSEKFWTVHPREMTYSWTDNRVPQARLGQVLRGALISRQTRLGTNVEFSYPVNRPGFGAIADALAPKQSPLHLGHRATLIDAERRVVRFNDTVDVPYRTLVSTIPLPELVRICPQAPEPVRNAASRLRTNRILVVNLGIDQPAISDKHWVHFPEPDVSFFRLSYPHNFAENVAPPGMSSISAEVAYAGPAAPDEAKLTERVIEDLYRVGALNPRHRITARMVRDIPYGYCLYDHDREQSLETIMEWLPKAGIVACGRYGLWTYFWSDETIQSGLVAAGKL